MPSSPSHLKKRKLGWYVRIDVPRRLQQTLGFKTVTRSLHTRDKVEAERRRHAVIAAIFSELRQAEAVAPTSTEKTPEGVLQTALREREAVAAGDQILAHAEAAVEAAVDDYLDQQAALHGRDSEGNPRLPASSEAMIRRAYSAVKGRADLSLSHNVAAYLQEQERRLTAQTIAEKRKTLEAFLGWFGSERECSEVTRRVAGTYVTEVIQKRTRKDAAGEQVPLSATTLGKEVGDLRAFFSWAAARGAIDPDADLFFRMASTVKGSSRGKAPAHREWKPAELSKLFRGVPANDPVWAMSVIAAYTGMRREEVATLRVDSIESGSLIIEEGKSAAATRRVPIHPAIAPLVKQLAKTTTDEYLIPGLLRGGPDQKRGWLVGKRFGRVIRQLGIDDPRLDFHAFRHTAITQLEEAGVPVPTIQLIVGHRRQGITLGVYSGGVSDKVKREAVRKISYGKLDAYVAETGAGVTVEAKSKARKKKEPLR